MGEKMTIEYNKDFGQFEAICDGCCEDHSEYHDRDEFHDFLEEIKALGWIYECNNGEHCHYCPSCAEDRDPDQLEDFI